MDEKWIVNKDNLGIRYVFVWLEPDPKSGKKKLPIHPDLAKIAVKRIEMDQPKCMFDPHAVAIREGQELLVKNSETIAHNFKWTGEPNTKNEGGNVLMPAKTDHLVKDLVPSRLPILVECNLHPWMKAYLRVYNHPYYAVTDGNGAFEFVKAPAGEYRLKVWHGSAGWRGGAKGKLGEPITIKAGIVTVLKEIEFPPPAN